MQYYLFIAHICYYIPVIMLSYPIANTKNIHDELNTQPFAGAFNSTGKLWPPDPGSSGA